MARIWKTREGTLIPLEKMEDSHLANTRNMLLRNLEGEHPRCDDSVMRSRWRRFVNAMDDEIYRRECNGTETD